MTSEDLFQKRDGISAEIMKRNDRRSSEGMLQEEEENLVEPYLSIYQHQNTPISINQNQSESISISQHQSAPINISIRDSCNIIGINGVSETMKKWPADIAHHHYDL